jgi:hypothetical protein
MVKGVRVGLAVKYINEEKGYGVVAREVIPENTFISEYVGEAYLPS